MTRNLRKQLRKIKLKRIEIEMSKCDLYLQWYNLWDKYFKLLDRL